MWPSRAKVDQHMPADFKDKYPSIRVIIDCTEIRCQMLKKNHITLKGLVGISPGGAITFISQLYTGHISDREIATRSGFLNLTEETLSWQIRGLLWRIFSPWSLPECTTFFGNKGQMSPEEVVEIQSIASLRIHVEREINKVKSFHLWDSIVPFTMFGVVNQMWFVCTMLCNFQNSIISE